MLPSSNMDDELKFQQRWEIRRRENEFDSSSEESKSSSSSQPVLKKLKLVSSFASDENDEAIGTDRVHQKGKYVPGTGRGKVKFRKAKKMHVERRRNDNLVNNVMERDSHGELGKKKNNTNAYDPAAALDDVKIFMESLLEDLKSTRENLFRWMREEMQKMVADDTAPKAESRKGRYGRGKNQMQHQNNFEEDIVQPQKDLKSGTRDRTSNHGSLNRCIDSNEAAGSKNHCQALEDQVEYGKTTGSMASIANEKGETRLVPSIIQNFQSGHSVQVQHQKNVVLGLRAQNCNDGSSERSVKGKRTAEFNNCSKGLGFLPSAEKAKGERLGLTANPNSFSNSSNQVASSMYLTLPTVLPQPCVENYRLETSSCNYVHPRTDVNKRDVYSEDANVMINSSANRGWFSAMQQEERLGSFALNQSIIPASRSIGAGLQAPLHQTRKNVPKENHNIIGLTMNGGAIRFSGGNHALSEQYAANNFHRHSNCIPDTGLTGYQISDLQESRLFPK
ncbi:uncharacterized protein LOC133854715 [Alnus glutinosa]|uniref:uncharacterized protein LOC133854715 n=1 Tax=Alnus glutinosa TaxID=3517 RepID=UPI002D796F92|nr:uncharacterized protein LOC133854715 [Alnus glutinosa]